MTYAGSTLTSFDPFTMTDPDGIGSFFSSSSGFGPGDYSGGYTGQGDRVYWGPDSGGVDPFPPPAVLKANVPDKFNTHMGGGVLVKGAGKVLGSEQQSMAARAPLHATTWGQNAKV